MAISLDMVVCVYECVFVCLGKTREGVHREDMGHVLLFADLVPRPHSILCCPWDILGERNKKKYVTQRELQRR